MPRIKKVTYSKPVTIIRWDDNTITKAFCDEVDNYDELTGFLMCIIKKMVPAKEMRKLFSKYVYGDDPKYIKRIVPKKERKKIDPSPWFCTSPYCNTFTKPITLELDEDTVKEISEAYGVEEFLKKLADLVTLFNDEE